MNKSKTTISDIARALGITPSAVSKALNQHPRISEQTRKAVAEMAEQLNYQRNQLATALRKGSSQLLGVLIPATNLNFFSSVIKGVEEAAQQAGYQVIIAQSKDHPQKEEDQLTLMANLQVDGILATIANKTTHYGHFERLVQKQIPLVLFDRTAEGLDVGQVLIDDFAGAYKAVSHLAEQGYQRIAHLAGFHHVTPYRKRQQGYLAALKDHGLAALPEWLIESELDVADGRRIAEQLLALPQPPDAFFASSDAAALGVFQTLQDRGWQVPQQVGIVGFSNEPFTALLSPSLSTVDQQSELMGAQAAELLINQIQNPDFQNFNQKKIILEPQLIIRQSSLKKYENENSTTTFYPHYQLVPDVGLGQ